jgi:hypothetical protein
MTTLMSPSAPRMARGDPSAAERRKNERRVSSATRVTVSAIGTMIALAGIEHGVGEILQGNVASDGIMIESWPESDAFRILSGEPAMTVVPNLLVTGILAVIVSLLFLVWVTAFIQRKHGGLVLILLSLVMLLVGGGFGPPLIGILLGIAATRINAPLGWWRTHLTGGTRWFLATAWPWFLGADLIAFLSLFPGMVLVGHFFSGDPVPDAFVYALILSACGFLGLSIVAAFAYDIQHQRGEPLTQASSTVRLPAVTLPAT